MLKRLKLLRLIFKLKPFDTFKERLVAKLSRFIGFNSCEFIEMTTSGNSLLKLKRKTPLGRKSKIIQLPKDAVIYESVIKNGFWSLDESIFLSKGLKDVVQRGRTCFLDIGANTGLISLQVLNKVSANYDNILVEPISQHIEAIKENVASTFNGKNVKIYPYALGVQDGQTEIFIENLNRGNTSLLRELVPSDSSYTENIGIKSTLEFSRKYLKDYDFLVIKSDIQGFDSVVLSQLPQEIWDKTYRAVIEVWAHSKVNQKEVNTLCSLFDKFEFLSWSRDLTQKVQISELKTFWLCKNGKQRNLFLSR